MGNRRIILEVSLRNEKIRLHLKNKKEHVFALYIYLYRKLHFM